MLQRYSMQIEQAADPAAVYALNQALVQVMERGTGRTARTQLPAGLTVAGKTGTSDDLRDSWFAGFTNEHLAVAWIGYDDDRPTGLTGATGAAKIWVRVVAALEAGSYSAPAPDSLETVWVDYLTGEPSAARCDDAVALPLPAAERAASALEGCAASRSARGCGIGSAPTRHERRAARRSRAVLRASRCAARDARRVHDARGHATARGSSRPARARRPPPDRRARRRRRRGAGAAAPPELAIRAVRRRTRAAAAAERRRARRRRCSRRAAPQRAAGRLRASERDDRARAPHRAKRRVALGRARRDRARDRQRRRKPQRSRARRSRSPAHDSVAIADAQKLLRAAGGR